MSRIGLKIKYLGVVASFVLAFAALGCSSHTGPDQANLYQPGYVFENPDFVVIHPTSDGLPELYMSSRDDRVSADKGGTVSKGRVSLYFPPGAVDSDVKISIKMDDSGLFIADLAPEGLHFNEPVMLNFDLHGTSAQGKAASTFIAWFNEETGHWEMIENLPPADSNNIRGILYHFSKYSGVNG